MTETQALIYLRTVYIKGKAPAERGTFFRLQVQCT